MTTKAEVTQWNKKNENDEKDWEKEFLDLKTIFHSKNKYKMCSTVNALLWSTLQCCELKSNVKIFVCGNSQESENLFILFYFFANFYYTIDSI